MVRVDVSTISRASCENEEVSTEDLWERKNGIIGRNSLGWWTYYLEIVSTTMLYISKGNCLNWNVSELPPPIHNSVRKCYSCHDLKLFWIPDRMHPRAFLTVVLLLKQFSFSPKLWHLLLQCLHFAKLWKRFLLGGFREWLLNCSPSGLFLVKWKSCT